LWSVMSKAAEKSRRDGTFLRAYCTDEKIMNIWGERWSSG